MLLVECAPNIGLGKQAPLQDNDTRRLTIEVKTSAQGLSGLLHLTRNEWNLATESLNHVFHLWDIRSVPPRLAVLNIAS